MALTGWSLTSGDLRIAHFLATHMMQAVPVAALLAAYALPDRAKRPIVIGVVLLWGLWALIAFHGALAGNMSFILDVVFR